MAQLYTKVKKYLEANSKTWEAEKDNIQLQNDSDGNGDISILGMLMVLQSQQMNN